MAETQKSIGEEAYLGMNALRQEIVFLVHEHPFAVVFEAKRTNFSLIHLDTISRFDRVQIELYKASEKNVRRPKDTKRSGAPKTRIHSRFHTLYSRRSNWLHSRFPREEEIEGGNRQDDDGKQDVLHREMK